MNSRKRTVKARLTAEFIKRDVIPTLYEFKHTGGVGGEVIRRGRPGLFRI